MRTADPDVLEQFAGTSALSSLSLHVPAEALYYLLSFGMTWTYPTVYGFIGTCRHEHFLIFVLDRPIDVNVDDASVFARMTPGLGNVMNTRAESALIIANSYVTPERTYPLNRRPFSRGEVSDYLRTYIEAVGATFAWLSDFNNFGSAHDPGILDIDFAQATWLTVFVLLVTQFIILESQHHISRKLAYFDALELLAALVKPTRSGQAKAWNKIASDEFCRTTLLPAVGRYGGGFGTELVGAVEAMRASAARTVNSGLIYPKSTDGLINVPNRAPMSFNAFEPSLYRALRNTRHGFAIKDSDLLSIHTGEIDNDLPDLSIALFLGFVMDKIPYQLSRQQ